MEEGENPGAEKADWFSWVGSHDVSFRFARIAAQAKCMPTHHRRLMGF